MNRYNPVEIEKKWQDKWSDTQIYAAKDFADKPKFVMLTEFPYPSGAGLHMGHMREYTLGDIMARHKRMTGHNVLFPMGFDAFGLPTENYAIKNKIAPQVATENNVAKFRSQMDSMGFGIDWSRSFSTTDPDYYKWTQWLFLQFFKAGLAFQEEVAINWCPFCKTGLANEEVVNGRHERCDNLVEKKTLKQWMLRITDYADRLIDGLKTVDYPSRIADQQVNWIGRSIGAEVDFAVDGHDQKITVFTTRPDTIFGATFMVLAPEHPLVEQITTPKQKGDVETYIRAAQAKSEIERQNTDREKTGVFTGAYAVNPANDEKIPIWIADYVLMGYGTGAIMAVPAHDERDYEFAEKFNIPVVEVVAETLYGSGESAWRKDEKAVERTVAQCIVYHPTEDKIITLDVPAHNWTTLVMGGIELGESIVEGAGREIIEETGYKNFDFVGYAGHEIRSEFWASHKNVNRIAHFRGLVFKLRDLERQPIAPEESFQHNVKWRTLAEALAALTQSEPRRFITAHISSDIKDTLFTSEGTLTNSGKFNDLSSVTAKAKIVAWLAEKGVAREKVNYKLRDWIFSRQHYWGEPIPIIHCPTHGAVAVPDDQLPVELPPVDHYEPTDDGKSPLSRMDDWVNTTCPKCGGPAKRETDTMPNWAGSNWYYLRYFDAHNDKNFVDPEKLKYWGAVDLYLGGMEHTTLHLLYSRFHHQFLYDQGLVPTPEPYAARRGQGIILAADGRKMSKSLGNVVDPTEVINSGYGADAARLLVAFLAPYDQTTPWSPEGIAGTYRFLVRYFNLAQEVAISNLESTNNEKQVQQIINRLIKKVSEDIDSMNFNTAIAAMMEALNYLNKLTEKGGAVWRSAILNFTKLLAPFAPHIAEEVWSETFAQDGTIHLSEWPTWDESLIQSDKMTIAVQVNGKLRGEITVSTDAEQTNIEQQALQLENVQRQLGDKKPARVIYVPGKIVNIVAK